MKLKMEKITNFNLTETRFKLTETSFNLTEARFELTETSFNLTEARFELTAILVLLRQGLS